MIQATHILGYQTQSRIWGEQFAESLAGSVAPLAWGCTLMHKPSARFMSCFTPCRETPTTADERANFIAAASNYSKGSYDLLDHNCNTFSNHYATFLTGEGISVLPEALMFIARWLSKAASSQSRWQTSSLLSSKPGDPHTACMSLLHTAYSMLQAATCWALHADLV